jgi:hypothetical protein
MMAQQSPPPVKKSVTYLQWSGVLLFLCALASGIVGIVVKFDIIPTIIAFVLACIGVPLSILQVDKNAFSFVLREKKTGVQLFGILILLSSLVMNYYLFTTHQAVIQTVALTPVSTATMATSATTISPLQATDQSSLIPVGRTPVVSDPLANNNQGYGWDTGENAQKTGSCDFVQGVYLVSAPAGSSGIGCNMEKIKGTFSNFVYQIKMTILEGIDTSNAAVGPTFRVSDTGTEYQVFFDQNGFWSVNSSSGALSHPNSTAFPYFVTGLNQPNYITIRADGNNIQIQVNGHDLGSYVDNTSASGFLGVQLSPWTSTGKAAFSDMRVWQL